MRLSRINKFAGLILGGVSILLFLLASAFPDFSEIAYGNTVYPVIRWLFDYTFGLAPFPLVYLFPVLLGFLFWRTVLRRKSGWEMARGTGNFLGILIALFYSLWGYNYARPSLSDRLPHPPQTISDTQILNLAAHTIQRANAVRTPKLMDEYPTQSAAEQTLRPAVEQVLLTYHIRLRAKPVVRGMAPAGILRKFGITGIYFPYTGEALVEDAQPQPEKIFVMAHELAHSYGITDEGDANLVAYLACMSLPQKAYGYAAHLSMWQYLRWVLKKRELDEHKNLKGQLSSLVQSDLEMLKKERLRYREWVPQLGDVVNDTYLKIQGVEMGTKAYNTLPERYLQHRPEPVR